MSHYKPYPAYRDSGVEWIGRVPEHWVVKRLKHLLEKPLQYGANESGDASIEEGPRYIRITDLNEAGELRNDTVKLLPPEIAQPYMLCDGDILFARSGATVGKTYRYKSEQGSACFAGYLIRARLDRRKAHSDFVILAVRSHYYWAYIHRTAIQATIENVSAERYGEFPIAVPSCDEQERIVVAVSKILTRIDTLITKKTRFIELLKEKRTALITHAVTKGIDPKAKMIDSGVEWIGEVPEHWLNMSLKRLAAICNGKDYKDVADDDGDYPVMGSGGEFARASSYLFTGESVLLGRKGTIDKPLYINGPFWAVDTMFYTEIPPHAFPKFVYYLALNIPFGRYSTNTALPSMTGEVLSSHQIAAPNFDEQKAIANFLDRETTRIDTIIIKTQHSIDLLKERRSAFITAAVTGQIDLRESI